MAIHSLPPGGVREGGPVVGVETGAVLEDVLVHVQHEAFLVAVDGEEIPRHREQALAQTTEAAPAEDRIGDLAIGDVDHQLLERTELVPGGVHDRVALQGRSGEDRGRHTGSPAGVIPPSTLRSARAASTRR